MKKLYVYSTLSADVAYTNHADGGGDMPIALPPVLVKGGAGIANDRFFTPRGVVTEVTEEQAEYLRANPIFRMHEKNGFVQVSEASTDPEKAAADMQGRDKSAPVVPEELKEDDLPVDPEPAPAKRSRKG